MYDPYASPDVLPMFRGRRGAWTTALCALLGSLVAGGVWLFAVRTAIEPACRTFAAANQFAYVDFRTENHRRDSGVVCRFVSADGRPKEVALREMAPYLTDLWVGVAMSPLFTMPACTILLAAALATIYHGRNKE